MLAKAKLNLSKITSLEGLRQQLAKCPLEEKRVVLGNMLHSLNQEIEIAILEHQNQLALYKLDQSIIFEDELHVVERQLMSVGIYA